MISLVYNTMLSFSRFVHKPGAFNNRAKKWRMTNNTSTVI